MPDTTYLDKGDWGICQVRYPVADYPDIMAVVNAAMTSGYLGPTGLAKDQVLQQEGNFWVLWMIPTGAFEQNTLETEELQNGVQLIWGIVDKPGTVPELPKNLDTVDEFKAINEDQRTVSGWVSTPDADMINDIVKPSAFEKSFIRNPNPPVCFQHDMKDVIGRVVEWRIDPIQGLWVTAKISQTATKAWTLVKEGIVKHFSFGYKILNSYFDAQGRRVITDLDLLEVSLVGVPMNDRAEVMAFSGKSFDAFIAELTEIRKAVAEDQEYIKSVSDELAPIALGLFLTEIAGDLQEEREGNRRTAEKAEELLHILGRFADARC